MPCLGLDIGTKTIGVAASDELGWTAQPIETIRYSREMQVFHRLHEIAGERNIAHFVVGLPLNMNGSHGPQAKFVEALTEKITGFFQNKGIELQITYWDERLSTMAAERGLLEADLSRKKRAKVIDKMAAVFILQGYLDAKG